MLKLTKVCSVIILLIYTAVIFNPHTLSKAEQFRKEGNLYGIPYPIALNRLGNSNYEAISLSTDSTKSVLPKYNAYLKYNKEIAGWIKIKDTRINYPIVRHNNNSYYLTIDAKGRKAWHGAIYIDYRNSKKLTDRNTLIYGHNMKDGLMFNDLLQYKKKSFFNKHRLIDIDDLYTEGLWEVFSVFTLNADKETIDIFFSSDNAFLKALEGYKKRSLFKTDTKFKSTDRIVSLVTCSYETHNTRTVVMAKYIGPAEKSNRKI